MDGQSKPRIGLIGYGYWGPNLLRNLVANGECEVAGIVEARETARNQCRRQYPHLPIFSGMDEFFSTAKKQGVQAMIIATPPATHMEVALRCISEGCDVLIEKPMALSVKECDAILAAAKTAGRRIMVDHTFVYNPAVQYLAEQAGNGSFGDLLYYDSVRVNFGGFQAKTNVLWDLAPHDLSILDLLTGGLSPTSVSAVGIKHFEASVENLCYVHLNYPNNLVAHLNLNWVAPLKVRSVMLGGSKRMAVYDENLPAEKIKIYDKNLSIHQPSSDTNDFRVSYRVGDMVAPAISNRESLTQVIAQFVSMVKSGANAPSDGHSGRRVVEILEAASLSMSLNGAPIELKQRIRRLAA